MGSKDQKVYFAQKYGLAEREITVEFIPLLMAFDNVTLQNEKLAEQNRQLLEKVEKVVNPVINEHYYEGLSPVSAFLLRWGWTTPVFVGLLIGGCLWYILDRNRQELAHIKEVFHYNDSTSTYRIPADNYKLVKEKDFKGIDLLVPKK